MLRTISTDTITRLLDQPLTTAPAKKELESNTDVSVIGTYGEYLLVKHGEELGWIK